MAVVLLVRHAQASFGASDYDVLSSRGEEQAEVLAQRLARLGVDRLVHGRMRRQQHTAEICRERLADVPLEEHAAWGEYDHEAILAAAAPTAAEQAALEERLDAAEDPRRAFQEVFEAAVGRWTCGEHDADYAEPYTAFRRRVRDGLEALLDGIDGSGTVAVVTSGGAISAVVADQLGLDPVGWRGLNRVLVNTSVTKLVHGRSGTTLLTVNDHAHLETGPRELLTYR